MDVEIPLNVDGELATLKISHKAFENRNPQEVVDEAAKWAVSIWKDESKWEPAT